MRQSCERQGVVGGSLMFLRAGEQGLTEVGFEGYGFADRDAGRAVDRDTIFHWASCTKTLTGIAMMQLRDRGRLELADPIVGYLPELREVHDPFGKLETITLRHLLSHSAGFRAGTWPWKNAPWQPHEPTRWSQLVAMMPYTELEFEPGTRFSYSNPGIVLLGQVLEQLTGDDYEVYMQKNVLGPLGMTCTYYDITPYHLQRFRSHSYARTATGTEDLGPDFDTGITVSNGGLNAPLPDMARYLAFLLGACEAGSPAAGVLARDSLREMWQPQVASQPQGSERIGLTFFLQEHEGSLFPTHTGGQRSFVTFFYVHPDSGTAALGAFNTGTSGPTMAAMRRQCMQLSMKLR
ncbi:MAG: beta-lactamase family protein [Planctomycetes bacterium]|nr:beta-lactamase family protein [Planctomycetota bacterium]